MCSISGILMPRQYDNAAALAGIEAFREMVIQAEDRGRDSFGLAIVTTSGFLTERKFIGKPSLNLDAFKNLDAGDIGYILNNNRAEPTTEYVYKKSVDDVQPFVSGGWIVAHNGTIANDKDLCDLYELTLPTAIDSMVIPALLSKCFQNDFSDEKVEEIIAFIRDKIVGSYALAIGHKDYPDKVLLVANYKPLFVTHNSKHSFFMFTSLDSYLSDVSPSDKLLSEWTTVQVPPYSAMLLTPDVIKEFPLLVERSNKKALVVCSGGLDSTVVAAKAIADGYEVTLLHFRYNCRAESREVIAVRAIGERLNVPVEFVDTDLFSTVIGHSRLTRTLDTAISDGVAGAEFAHEWVPARNLIMLSIATGIAEARGFDTIMLGNNLEESGAYPDNEMEFINKLNATLPYATQVNKRVFIQMPVGNLMKHEIVKLGLEIDAPLDLCWSCYEAGEIHCGHCGPCFMRKTAFKINHQRDMIPYSTDEYSLCDSCKFEGYSPSCPSVKIVFGSGLGGDNIVKCDGYSPLKRSS